MDELRADFRNQKDGHKYRPKTGLLYTAFVEFQSPSDAEKALQGMKDRKLGLP
jgi:RNA recognition motif-containing protein